MTSKRTPGRTPNRYELNGKLYTLRDLSSLSGIPTKRLRARISSEGMSVSDAFARGYAPKHKVLDRRYTFHGQTLTLREWADRFGLNEHSLRTRLRDQNLTVEQALSIPTPAQRRRGVVSNFEDFEGTGAGNSVCESPDITFHEEALSP